MHSDILKHLDIIKDAVALQDEDLIAMQVQALQNLPLDAKVKQILALISTQRFQYVIQLIEQYQRDNNGLTSAEDPQTQGLKLEWKVLKDRTNELTDTQADIERCCNVFQNEYMAHLGNLLEEILKLQAETSLNTEEQQQAQQAYESFHRNHEYELGNLVVPLSYEEKQQLKAIYQLASSLCHPDKLASECKAQGTEIFKVLNETYHRQDLQRMMKILRSLETGKYLSHGFDTTNDKATLQAKIADLRKRIAELEVEIADLQNSETYQRIQDIDDKEVYFSGLEQSLQEKLEALRCL
jgi:hypothetical protein